MEEINIINHLGMKLVSLQVTLDDTNYYTQLSPGIWNYGAIVSALVRSKYSESESEAILANSLLLMTNPSSISDDEISDKQKEFNDFQEWREKCKAKAKELLELGKEKGLVET